MDCLGGAFGDVKEAGEKAIGCFCCLMCTGPILIIIGILTFVASFTDTRGALIAEYDTSVTSWNGLTSPGLDISFTGPTTSAAFTLQTTTPQYTMERVVADENVHDTLGPLAVPKAVNLFQSKAADVVPLFKNTASSDYLDHQFTLTIGGSDGTSIPSAVPFTLMKKQAVRITKVCPPSSSSTTSSVTCMDNAIGCSYSGTRWRNKQTCSAYCAAQGANFYRFNNQVYCWRYWGLEEITVRVKLAAGGGAYSLATTGVANTGTRGGGGPEYAILPPSSA
jgi:hypothetical protein